MNTNENEKNQILTIPNCLSFFRIVLIPAIVFTYCGLHNYILTACLLVLSGLTDIADGIIARKFNMTSELGKLLDPVADKLTQATVIVCLALHYKWMRILAVVFALKETAMVVFGLINLDKSGKFKSARWYGKVNTVLFYCVTAILILFPDINYRLATALICFCFVSLLVSLTLYIVFYITDWKKQKEKRSDYNEKQN